MTFKDKYVVFNNTGKNVSLEVLLPLGTDPTTLPYYKRRKYLNSKRVPLLIPRGTSLDLVEATKMSYKDLEDNKDLQEKMRLLGPEFKVIERTISYSFDADRYLEIEEFIDPNFGYVEPTIDNDIDAFIDSIPQTDNNREESKESKIKRLEKEAENILKPKKKKAAKKKTTKKKATVKKTDKKESTTSRNLTKKASKKASKKKEE